MWFAHFFPKIPRISACFIVEYFVSFATKIVNNYFLVITTNLKGAVLYGEKKTGSRFC